MSLIIEWITLAIPLLNNMALIVLCAYIFSHSGLHTGITEGWKNRLQIPILTVLATAIGIYGTLNSIPVLDVRTNIRNLGPIIGGLLGGPVVGGIAGTVAGLHRYFLGGKTALPCALAAIVAGLFAGYLYIKNDKKFIGLTRAVVFTLFIEAFHSILILLFHEDRKLAVASQTITMPVRMVVEGAGIALFAFIIEDIVRNRKIREEKQKVEQELRIARTIQMTLVPTLFPPLPNWPKVALYGTIEPARQVSGDFFDFFPLGPNRICFSVGDVSDKGIPAALFMAVTKTLIKAKSDREAIPSEIMSRVNSELCETNDSLMFVTIFCGIYDTTTGELQYCNAGHNPPFILTAERTVTTVPEKCGMALGVMADASFCTKTMNLKKEDMLLVYTDGFTEAQNAAGVMLGEDEAVAIIRLHKTGDVKETVEGIIEAVKKFQRGINQYDDITLLALKTL
jgi:sigma-B regulation protein RsbU (phosphoserine phosphatase)